jgi:hypothetical protein
MALVKRINGNRLDDGTTNARTRRWRFLDKSHPTLYVDVVMITATTQIHDLADNHANLPDGTIAINPVNASVYKMTSGSWGSKIN